MADTLSAAGSIIRGSPIGNTDVSDERVDSAAAYERDGTIGDVTPAACPLLAPSSEPILGFYAPRGRWYDDHADLADERSGVIARGISGGRHAALRLDALAEASVARVHEVAPGIARAGRLDRDR